MGTHRISRYGSAASVLLCLSVSCVFAQDPLGNWRVISPSSPLQVVSVADVADEDHGRMVLVLRNISQQTIAAFAIRSQALSSEVD